jgi:hypothetical protein
MRKSEGGLNKSIRLKSQLLCAMDTTHTTTTKKLSDMKGMPAPGGFARHRLDARADGWQVCGFVADTHLGSKHERLDVLKNLYSWFAAEGVKHVYHGGNWIEGEARFNRHDLKVFGLDNQIEYFIENYPEKPGITTYYVSGDDHEGWYQQRECLNIGQHLEAASVRAGREDLRYLGYVEADIALRTRRGAEAQMRIMHGGGGSSYAISYRPQRILESLQGGEKPAVFMIGHYHKMFYSNIRNVHVVLPGCTQDQSVFMRKKSIEAHIGGVLVRFKQNAKDGHVEEFVPHFRTFFDKGFYGRNYDK